MSIPSLDPHGAGITGLVWLLFSYSYALFYAANLIAEGSDLLLLLPSMSGVVGSIVLPLLGAVPDAAIMLFSGLGAIEDAQETLSVGVGALAGSTVMLLTVPWALSVYGGRVNLVGERKIPNYKGSPRLDPEFVANPWSKESLVGTGVAIPPEVRSGAGIMIGSTITYLVIQTSAWVVGGDDVDALGEKEKYWALLGFFLCLILFVTYLYLQIKYSSDEMEKTKRVNKMKQLLSEGKYSLKGVLSDMIMQENNDLMKGDEAGGDDEMTPLKRARKSVVANRGSKTIYPVPDKMKSVLRELLCDAFKKYDKDENGSLDRREVSVLLRDFNENCTEKHLNEIFNVFDMDNSETIDFDEFLGFCYTFLLMDNEPKPNGGMKRAGSEPVLVQIRSNLEEIKSEEEEEADEIPDDIADLSPEEQHAVIIKRAMMMLGFGTLLVVAFSDPLVDVLQEVAFRLNLSAFYVSFVLAPLASNASEVVASVYYASKKTRKTIAVSLTTLEGAAVMNNTFCLSIFMGLIYFRGLAWHYTAETIAIVMVQIIMAIVVQRESMTLLQSLAVLSLFPLSLALVAVLEAYGFD